MVSNGGRKVPGPRQDTLTWRDFLGDPHHSLPAEQGYIGNNPVALVVYQRDGTVEISVTRANTEIKAVCRGASLARQIALSLYAAIGETPVTYRSEAAGHVNWPQSTQERVNG